MELIRKILPGFFAILFIAHALPAQNISGTVKDDRTGEPLIYIRVLDPQNGNGTLTDENGDFEIRMRPNTKELIIGGLGYQSDTITRKHLKGELAVNLKEKDITFDEVVITSPGVELAYPFQKVHLFDYEFLGDYLMLLKYNATLKEHQLILVDENDSTIAKTTGLEPISGFYKDCLGNVHALSKNYACQIAFVNNELQLIKTDRKMFEEVVKPCIGYLDSTVYYEFYHNNQLKEFYFVKKGDKARTLAILADKERMRQMHDEGFALNQKWTPADILRSPASDNPDAMFQLFFLSKTFFKPLVAPLEIIDDEVLVFDHVNGEILIHDRKGEKKESIPVSYHKEKRWKEKIYVDEVRDQIYTTYEKSGITFLKEIDLESGGLSNSWKIPKFWINKIIVRDGIAYFLYKDSNYDDTNRLYKLRLK